MKPNQWYQIQAAGDEAAEILIYDEIGRNFWGEGIAAEELVKELAEMRASELNVRINSVGGQVFEGLAIFNALERHRGKVTTHVDGIAASIASVIALAGDEVRIAENAFLMVHNAWGITIGNRNDMLEMAATLEKLDGSIAGTYMRRTGKDEKQVREWMDAETWFTAAEALEHGFVDEVTEKRDVKAAFDLSRFSNVPDRVAAKMRAHAPRPEPAPEAAGPEPALVELAAQSERLLAETRL